MNKILVNLMGEIDIEAIERYPNASLCITHLANFPCGLFTPHDPLIAIMIIKA